MWLVEVVEYNDPDDNGVMAPEVEAVSRLSWCGWKVADRLLPLLVSLASQLALVHGPNKPLLALDLCGTGFVSEISSMHAVR